MGSQGSMSPSRVTSKARVASTMYRAQDSLGPDEKTMKLTLSFLLVLAAAAFMFGCTKEVEPQANTNPEASRPEGSSPDAVVAEEK